MSVQSLPEVVCVCVLCVCTVCVPVHDSPPPSLHGMVSVSLWYITHFTVRGIGVIKVCVFLNNFILCACVS